MTDPHDPGTACVRQGCGVSPVALVRGKWATWLACPTHLAHFLGFAADGSVLVEYLPAAQEISQVLATACR